MPQLIPKEEPTIDVWHNGTFFFNFVTFLIHLTGVYKPPFSPPSRGGKILALFLNREEN